MMRGMVSTLEKHHNVAHSGRGGRARRCGCPHRYIPSRQLPDKAVSLLDTACARVSMSQAAMPPAIEDRERRISLIDTEVGILDREIAAGENHGDRREALLAERTVKASELVALNERWEQEKVLAKEITDIRTRSRAPKIPPTSSRCVSTLTQTVKTLHELQGEEPLIYPVVDAIAVGEVVAGWTGIPMGRMQSNEIRTVLNLEATMGERIVGQPHALEAVAQAIQTSRAGMTDPRKPIGVFLMVGTSGTGKTETALTLADLLYGGEQNMTVINMSEFKEEHKVSTLMGSPPGYVGYGEGGVLTEAVRRRPYSVILLDEMEKAHPGVQDVFFQVFDKGNMKDGEGRDIDFKNTVIIMTSNAATDLIVRLCADPETMPDAAGLAEALMPELMKTFKPAFLGRVTLVPYFPLSPDIIKKIVGLQLNRIRRRVQESYGAKFLYDDTLIDTIAARCTETSSGARNVEKILSRTLLPELSAEVLSRLAEGNAIDSITVGVDTAGAFQYAID
jgi:type VI secretion system protein VasG